MKYAADFREIACDALRGKWAIAVLTGFIASLMGAGIATSGGGSSSSNNSNSSTNLFQEIQASEFWLRFHSIIVVAIVLLVVWVIITIIISGAAKLGYAIFNLKLVDHKEVSLSDLFSQFHRLGDGFCMNFMVGLFKFLWTLLFIIPGIIKTYSYAMTPYILAEHPDMTATEAITESRQVMDGNKWRLFCLEFSFIGWDLLCAIPAVTAAIVVVSKITMGENIGALIWFIPFGAITFVGSLFLRPYREAAYAAFYREVAGTPVETSEENTDNYFNWNES